MATYNISVLSTSSSGNGYRFSGTDKNGTISSSTNNPTINITAGDTINFTFSNSTSHPFTISGTTISGESATGGYYSTPTAESYTFSSTMTYTYVCNVHSSMTGSIIASAASATTTTTTTAPPATTTTTTTTTTAAPATTTTTTTTTSAPTTTTTTTTTTTASPTATTTTTTTVAPDQTATTTTTTTVAPDQTVDTTTTTTTTLAPFVPNDLSADDVSWKITARRSDLAKDPSTFFTFAPDQPTSKFITDIELETQKVDEETPQASAWIPKTPKIKTGNIPAVNDPDPRKITNIDTEDLSVGMLVTGVGIPGNTLISEIDDNRSTITISNPVTGEFPNTGTTITFIEYIPPKRRKMKDLPYIDYVSPHELPSTCSTFVSCNFVKPRNKKVQVEGPANNLKLSVIGSKLYAAEIRWGVSMRQRVIRLKSVQGVNEGGEPEGQLIDIPTSQVVQHSLYMGHTRCEGKPYESNKSTSSGPVDIPPEEFEGGEMNATQSQASMTKADPHGQTDDNILTTLTFSGGGDKEVTAIVSIQENVDFSMTWKVPATPKFTMEYAGGQNFYGTNIDRIDYDLYGYSFEVKDPIKSGWRQFAEYTDDTPAPSGCDGFLNPKFEGFITQLGGEDDRGEDQTVIRGHSGRVYLPGETLIAVFKTPAAPIDWVEVDRGQEPHIIQGIGPYRGEIKFERSREYIFRVRAIYKCSRLLNSGQVFTSTVYTEPEGESRDYWVKTSYHRLGGIYRARNSDFTSVPLTLDGEVFNAFDDDSVPDVPNQEPEFPEE